MHLGLLLNIFSTLDNEVIISVGTALVSLVSGYIIMRERILKTEMRLKTLTEYIDKQYELTNSKINNVIEDIEEFKELHKETSKSLAENTIAIRELKVVIEMLMGQLGVKNSRRINETKEK